MANANKGPDFRANARAATSITPERAAKGDFGFERVEDEEGRDTGERRVRFKDATPVDAYLRREQIDWRQHDAASWLARTYRRILRTGPALSSFAERVQCSASIDGPYYGSSAELQRAFLNAGLAWEDEGGVFCLNNLGRVAVNVCAHEEWAGGTRNLERLREALDRLADALKIGTKRR